MFFLQNTTSYVWSVLMPVWEWQVDAAPAESLQGALDEWMDAVVGSADPSPAGLGDGADPTEAGPGLPLDSDVLQAVARALAEAVANAQPPADAGPAPEQAPVPASPAAQVPPPAAAPVLAPVVATMAAPVVAPLVGLAKPAVAGAPAAPRKPVSPAATKTPVPAPKPPAATGHWVLAGWLEQSAYSLYRNPLAERAAEQPTREDQEHVLAVARQRRKPDCGQP